MDPKTALEPGVVIAERFRVDQVTDYPGAGPAFLATDQSGGDRLVVFDTTLDEADALRPAVGAHHAHLAGVRGLVAHGERDVLLTEHVPGLSVEAFADGTPRLSRVDAVRFALRLLDALLTLHTAGASHGLIRPAAVILEPEGRPRPVLAFAPPTAGPSAYRSPERGESGPPSVGDDAWAAGALLFRMLTGRDPNPAGLSSEDELTQAGIDDPILRASLLHSLAADPSERSDTVQPLRRELARWFADHAGDGSTHSSSMMSRPPPLPPGATPPPGAGSLPPPTLPSGAPAFSSTMPTEVQPKSRVSPLLFAGIAAVLGLGAAYGVAQLRAKPKVQVVTTSAPQNPPAASTSEAVSLGEVAVTGESEVASDAGRAVSCVAGHFPKDTFKRAPDLSWLCTETDPRSGGEKLRVAVVQGAAGGAATTAQQVFARLGWYEMAAYAVVRSSCCTDPKALELPAPSQGCDPLTQKLDELAKAVQSKSPVDDAVSGFSKAARCEADAKKASVFRRPGAPQSSEEAAFKELLKSVVEP
ncbi:MAG: hypothetical protein U0263_05710 [Polyangiaceae bacterium]